jgi:hypothetical protein
MPTVSGNPDPRPASAQRCWRQQPLGRIPGKGGGITPRSAHFVNRFILFSSWAWTQKLPGPASNGIVRSNLTAGHRPATLVLARSSRLGTGLPKIIFYMKLHGDFLDGAAILQAPIFSTGCNLWSISYSRILEAACEFSGRAHQLLSLL